jgi:ubiquinone/menaquinone biosynthesis C-methylase UbiE
MPRDRDVAAFDERAPGYESGWRGRLHHEIADRSAGIASACAPAPDRVLDVGCGTGYLLRRLASLFPGAGTLDGVDAAPGMIQVARSAGTDPRLRFTVGTAEHLPYDDGRFDLVVSTTSFDHWRDQRAGLAECARVLRPGGQLVLCDQFSAWLLPTLTGSRRSKARTRRRATALLAAAGFTAPVWHDVYTVLIRAVTATRTGADPKRPASSR